MAQDGQGGRSWSRRELLTGAAGAVAALGATAATVRPGLEALGIIDPKPVRVGILHSLTGTMSVSERSVVDAVLFALDELNNEGGVLGRRLVPVLANGASRPEVFAQQARRLWSQDKVSVICGCWTSASRKAVLPVMEELNGLLIYPVQYEGLEQSPNILYMGAAPNQQILPAVDWAVKNFGKRVFLLGSDYVFPRMANQIIADRLTQADATLVGEAYVPLGSLDLGGIVQELARAQPDVVLNSINGDSNLVLFRSLKAAGISVPTLSFSLAEPELQAMGGGLAVGHYAAWTYFQSLSRPYNQIFVGRFQRRYGAARVLSDPMEAAYCGLHLWAQAVKAAASVAVPLVRHHLAAARFVGPAGEVAFDPATQHAYKIPRIGKARSDGQFDIVWEAPQPVAPQPFPESRSVEDWQKALAGLSAQWQGGWAPPPAASKAGD